MPSWEENDITYREEGPYIYALHVNFLEITKYNEVIVCVNST
jgi:hypothetical protein